GTTIYAGAGPLNGLYSPTRLTARVLDSTALASAVSTQQYILQNSDGATWQTVDAGNLDVAQTPSRDVTAVLGGNVDLFTANAGYNQDIAIFVSDNGGADQLVAWKESGGFAGTFSPNAAFVQANFPMSSGHSYHFKLKWKANKPANGTRLFAGAGPINSVYSPTRLTVEVSG
ncbi:MAG TPA: hypothetical protein VIN56_03260, partial [Candidatus Dormibacteraeota bacterium]